MKTQTSRHSFQKDKRFSGVYQQQGRMLVDADWNELVDILKHRLDDALKDVVNSGAPHNDGIMDFSTVPPRIRWGSVYADGIKAVLRPHVVEGSPAPAGFQFTLQQDFPGVEAIAPSGNYVLYADVWERPIVSIEDKMLRDPGLHGADTCTRTRTMVQIKSCADGIEPETDTAKNPPKGNAGLDVSLRDTGEGDGDGDPCRDEITTLDQKTGNYLFRLEVHDVSGDPDNPDAIELKWSTENGAEQHVVREEGNLVDTVPPEFKTGDWIYELYNDTSETHLGVHLATVSGFPVRFDLISTGYPASIIPDAQYIRRWDGFCTLTRSNGNWTVAGKDGAVQLTQISDTVPDENATHGDVKFESGRVKIFLNNIILALDLTGKSFVAGDFWLAMVRDNTAEADRIQMISSEPVGINHHYVKIARVQSDVIVAPDSESTRKLSFPALSNLTAEKVGYDPANTQARWEDIHDNSAIPLPLTVQGAIDDLVDNLESSDIPYQLPPCTDDTAGQKSTLGELLRRIEGWGERATLTIRTLFDTLLCNLDSNSIPYLVNSGKTLHDVILDKTSGGSIDGDLSILNGDLSIDQDLTVAGNLTTSAFKLVKTPQNRYVLTSDATGNGSWEPAPGASWILTGGGHLITDTSLVTGNVGIGTTSIPNDKLEVNGNIRVTGSIVSPEGVLRDDNGGWIRTYANTGWRNHTHGGGWYMQDSTWIRSFGNKNIYHNSGILRTDGTLQVGSDGNRFVAKPRRVTGINTTDRLSILTVKGIGGPWGTGTIAITKNSTAVNGTGTSFLSEIGKGDYIGVQVASGTFIPRIVDSIVNDTLLHTSQRFDRTLSGAKFYTSYSLFRADRSNGSPVFVISHQGRVGIGTIDPGGYHLDVRGRCYSSDGWQTTNADYSEYFETHDGKAIPVATSVMLTPEGKIRTAKKGEMPIGIVTKNSALVGNSYREWPQKYLRDKFGRQIREKVKEEINIPEKKKITKERQKKKIKTVMEKAVSQEVVLKKGKYIQKEKIEKVKREVEVPVFEEVDLYDSKGKKIIGKHRVPVMESYEEEVDVLDETGSPVLVGSRKFITVEKPKINPEYDETKEYIPRSERPEWCCVGLLGQLPLRKGKSVDPSWIKIKDLSDKVELWLIK